MEDNEPTEDQKTYNKSCIEEKLPYDIYIQHTSNTGRNRISSENHTKPIMLKWYFDCRKNSQLNLNASPFLANISKIVIFM